MSKVKPHGDVEQGRARHRGPPRSRARSTSATWTPWSATATSATRWPGAPAACWPHWDGFDRADIGTFLKKVAVVITSRIGVTASPIWGTAFVSRRGGRDRPPSSSPGRWWRCCGRRSRGIKARGHSDVGDKTLLDALVPVADSVEASDGGQARRGGHAAGRGHGGPRAAAEATRPMKALRGRASYTGERSIGTLNAGAVAVAVLLEALADARPEP